MKQSEVLLKAVEVLDRDGWCRGEYTDGSTGHHCAVGAIRRAGYGEGDTAYWAIQQLATDLEEATGAGSVQNWNDSVARDKRHVQSMMRRTARRLEKEGR